MKKTERLSLQLVRGVVSASIEFYESEKKQAERVREVVFCEGAITALRVFMSMLEKGVRDEV